MSTVTQLLVILLTAVSGGHLIGPGEGVTGVQPAEEAGVLDPPQNALEIRLPTSNQRLFDNDGPGFYMYVDRNFQGRRSTPWEGGQWGFVRNPQSTSQGMVYTRFHAGVDIKPLYRDARGEPLDTVRAIGEGQVVYVSNSPGASNYGIYVVVEHWWSGAPFYSLYAHLKRADVQRGQRVRLGERLGLLGYTGTGINQRRAHVHLEVNMLMSTNFQQWFDRHLRPANNRHGIFNGMNMASIDVTSLFLEQRNNPGLTIEEFLTSKKPHFTVAVPANATFDWMQRYHFLVDDQGIEYPNSWEISFTQWGLPVAVRASERIVHEPVAISVERSRLNYELLTNGYISGSGERFHLSQRGLRHVELMTVGAHGQRPLLTD
jgi:murein DD-endopeptidase MepM/ murein hydrolase activator NlpD